MNAIPSDSVGREEDMEVGHETMDGLVEVGAVSERTKGYPFGFTLDGIGVAYIPWDIVGPWCATDQPLRTISIVTISCARTGSRHAPEVGRLPDRNHIGCR